MNFAPVFSFISSIYHFFEVKMMQARLFSVSPVKLNYIARVTRWRFRVLLMTCTITRDMQLLVRAQRFDIDVCGLDSNYRFFGRVILPLTYFP
jgi:hypothetical protein